MYVGGLLCFMVWSVPSHVQICSVSWLWMCVCCMNLVCCYALWRAAVCYLEKCYTNVDAFFFPLTGTIHGYNLKFSCYITFANLSASIVTLTFVVGLLALLLAVPGWWFSSTKRQMPILVNSNCFMLSTGSHLVFIFNSYSVPAEK